MNILLSFIIPLFILMDFIGTIPVFISLTKNSDEKMRIRVAVLASLLAGFMVLVFALLGNALLSYFDISLEAVRVGGGILLLYIAFEMILSGQSMYEAPKDAKNIIVSPLAIPMLAGPGCMSFAMISYISLQGIEKMYILAAILITTIIGAFVLASSSFIHRVAGDNFTRGLEKVTAVIISFVALEMILSGVKVYFGL